MRPVMLMETQRDTISLLTSRSLLIEAITIWDEPVEFFKDYVDDRVDMVCFGQYYTVHDLPKCDHYRMIIKARLGEEQVEYKYQWTS